MAVLGVDWGTKRIGLAVSDPACKIALPAGTLVRSDAGRDMAALARLVAERGIEEVVVGLPLHMDGRAGESAQAARRFADDLREATGLPVATLDERLSSVEAKRARDEDPRRGAPGKRRRFDAAAATLLLRTYLALREQREREGRERERNEQGGGEAR